MRKLLIALTLVASSSALATATDDMALRVTELQLTTMRSQMQEVVCERAGNDQCRLAVGRLMDMYAEQAIKVNRLKAEARMSRASDKVQDWPENRVSKDMPVTLGGIQ